MKIEFVINPEYDKKMVIVMLKGRDWEHRAKNIGLDMNLVKRINSANGKDFEKALKEPFLNRDNLDSYVVKGIEQAKILYPQKQ